MDPLPLIGSTKARILGLLRQEDRTAAAVAAELGIQVSAARKHLERMRGMGLVRDRFAREGPGRPKKVFALTEEGEELFPRRYAAVLDALLAKLAERRGDAPTEAFLAQVAGDMARSLVPGGGSGAVPVSRILPGLNELGFDVRASEQGGQCTITSRNCPILKVARSHRELVCRGLHAEMLRTATGASEVVRGKWILTGDPVCTHVLRSA